MRRTTMSTHCTKALLLALLAAAALAASLLVLVAARPAQAAFPGQNGKIVFDGDYYESGFREISVMNSDGSGRTDLTANDTNDFAPAISPDGSKIAFVSDRDGNDEIYLMDANGSNQTRLTNSPAKDSEPAFSADSRKIAFVSDRDGNNEIYVMNSDGSEQTNLTNDPGNDNDPTFSANSSKIAFTSDQDGNNEIYVMNSDGSGQTRLTNNTATDSRPSFSPDGSKIVFASGPDGQREVYVMNAADGSGQTNLTNNADVDDYAPAFSPDGTKVVFTSFWISNCPPGNGCVALVLSGGGITVMNSDGSGQTLLSNSPYDERPDWGVRGPDTIPPETTITSGPSLAACPRGYQCAATPTMGGSGPTSDNTPTFSFSGSDDLSASANLLYSYKVDDGEWSNYSSETSVTLGGTSGLSDGFHTFYVKAKDEAGNEDQTPAQQSFAVDTTPPETTITSGPSGPTNDNTPTFSFSGSDNLSMVGSLFYSYKVDDGEWSAYSADTSATLGGASGLSDGPHTLYVKAQDEAGNEDGSPAQQSFTVDTAAPTGTVLINDDAARTRTRSVTLTLSATDPSPGSGVTQMRISNTQSGLTSASWEPYATSKSWTLSSGAGTKTVYVHYRDAAGNTSAVAQDTIKYSP